MIYRIEHPKPQFERENWLNLNGEWNFSIDYSNSGKKDLDKKVLISTIKIHNF